MQQAGDHAAAAHDAHDADDAHGGHGGHGDDAADVPTLVPTSWRQLLFPALILLLVGILLIGPVSNAFSPRPAAPATNEQPAGGEGGDQGAAHESTPTRSAPQQAETTATLLPTVAPESTPTTSSLTSPAIATRTAVAIAGQNGVVTRAPVSLQFGSATFTVKPGNSLLPDWKPVMEEGTATWIEGTYANHILYLPYSEQNQALFGAARPGDTVKVQMDTGQVFVFEVTRSQRAANGPPSSDGQFTVTTAMAQDHAGVTLFLIGDPAADRAVVQADFTGTIQ